ncbi:hypothetical protein [Psychroserpens damuponensis]|uniref:hypothetical protein n=1 Tax=Psychroserpens damuponensis TaxID=943936 RepID=UPI00058F42CD|nr:hypothetical protein [Psychroserpens damuponensis]
MKTRILGLCLLGLANLLSAQNEIAMVTNDVTHNTYKPKTVNVNNAQYLNVSFNNNDLQMAERIKKLQQIAANYDITKDPIYSTNKTVTYDVLFESNANFIKAVYDYNGDILSTEEYYEGIRVPYELSKQVAQEFPGWSFNLNRCKITYAKSGAAILTYDMLLKKGHQSKSISRTFR